MANRFKILILVLIFVISTISILNFEKNIVIGDPQTENWSEEVKLIALNGEPNDVFGDSHSISIDGDYAVIGAYGDDNEEGSAYVFKREGNSWIQETKLTPSDGEPEDRFGGSVSLDGDYAVIGAYGDDSKEGSAYVFTSGILGDDKSVTNLPPIQPYNPYPDNYEVNIPIENFEISWLCSDPDGDQVTYDIFFGITPSPIKIISNQRKNSYKPGKLGYDTTYYWQIKTWDSNGVSTLGPEWQFTTESKQSEEISADSIVHASVYNQKTKKPIPNTIVMIDDDEALHYTDANGKTTFSTTEGVHTFYLWKDGYLAKDYTIDLIEGNNTVTIYLEPGSVMLVDVTAEAINYTEIQQAGINIQEPENYDYYEFDVDLFIEEHKLTEYEVWFEVEEETTWDKITSKAKDWVEKGKNAATKTTQYLSDKAGEWISKKVGNDKNYVWVPKGEDPFEQTMIRYDDGKGNSGYFKKAVDLAEKVVEKVAEVKDKLTNQETNVWIHVEGTTHVLKEFFAVSVEIQNTVSPAFSFEDVELTLNLPTGLSLPDLYYEAQPTQIIIDKIQGQSDANVTWIVRGDTLGSYSLSVDVDAVFMPFNAEIEASGSTIVDVYGLSRLEPIFTPAQYVRKNLPFIFTIGIHNPSPIPAYLVSIELYNEALENVTVIGNKTVELGTINPGKTKYAAWTLEANVSGFIVLDASSVYTDTDYNLNPKLTFYSDTPEGAVTAFYIASQQMLNAEVHALGSEVTQFRMVFRTSIWDVLRLVMKTGLLFHTITCHPYDILCPVEYALFLTHFVEGVQYNMLCNDEIISTQSEEEILDIFIATAYNHTPVDINTFEENMTVYEISEWLNDQYYETINLIRDNEFTTFSDEESQELKDVISQLNVAVKQESLLQFQNNFTTIGQLIPLLSEAKLYRDDYEFYKHVGDLLTIASFSSVFRIGKTTHTLYKILKMGSTVGKGLGLTKEHTIKNLLKAVTIKALATYPLDLRNLTQVQSQVFKWLNRIITEQHQQISTTPVTSDVIITDFVTPDISTENELFGTAQGYLVIQNQGETEETVNGKIIIRIASEGNPILQSIPITKNIQPGQQSNITFEYSAMVLPGQPQEYIAETYLSTQSTVLPTYLSLFHTSLYGAPTQKQQYTLIPLDVKGGRSERTKKNRYMWGYSEKSQGVMCLRLEQVQDVAPQTETFEPAEIGQKTWPGKKIAWNLPRDWSPPKPVT